MSCKAVNFFKKIGPTPAFFIYFRSFQTNTTIFTTNQCERMSIMCWDSNPQPSKHESSPITTRPELRHKIFYKAPALLVVVELVAVVVVVCSQSWSRLRFYWRSCSSSFYHSLSLFLSGAGKRDQIYRVHIVDGNLLVSS